MRVIAGRLGGRTFDAPKNTRTHPMSDRVRGALFNALGDIEGMSVLDAYAGSGALAIEAISRGATWAEAIDMDKKAAETIKKNIESLRLSRFIKATQANIVSWSAQNEAALFDLVFIDQPYDKTDAEIIQKLLPHVADHGLLVLSWPGGDKVPEIAGATMIKNKGFNDAQLYFYRKL